MPTKQKKILILSAADVKGGAALHAWDLMRELKKKGHQVRMLVGYKYSNDDDVGELKRSFLKHIKIKGRGLDLYLKALFSYITSNDISYFNKKSLLNHPWYKEAEYIHMHNIHNYFFNLHTLPLMAKEKKIIWTLHDMWSVTGHCSFSIDCEKWRDGCGHCPRKSMYPPILFDRTKKIRTQKGKIYSQSNFELVVPSKWLGTVAKNSILAEKKVHHIPYGINTDIFKVLPGRNKIRTELGLPLKQKIACFCANHGLENQQKGGSYVLELVKRNPDILFLLIGGRKKSNFPNVKNISYISDPSELAKYFNAADALLLPSVAENYPFVVLEAMSCGLPITGFNCGGVTEQIKHKKSGYLAQFPETNDLDKGLTYILSLKQKDYKQMSINAAAFGSAHTYKRNVAGYLKVLNTL